jgi:hypothetical protein
VSHVPKKADTKPKEREFRHFSFSYVEWNFLQSLVGPIGKLLFFFGAIACLKPRVTIEAESSSDEPGLRARRPHKVISETEDYAKVLKPYREVENLNAIA